ncbi:MAG: deoxyribose-phosphate aldolase [Flavobacteriales bacterium]|nr:deoxyribose-phosphate aldolase [Flavobacteriales bacterium]
MKYFKTVKGWVVVAHLFVFISCQSDPNHGSQKANNELTLDSAEVVLNKVISAYGGGYTELQVAFRFREFLYTVSEGDGGFRYTRSFTDTASASIMDIYTNSSFERIRSGKIDRITPEKAKAYSNSINSVVYFALLPYKLRDPAVVKEYKGLSHIKCKAYHTLKVTFTEEGGGEDHDDEFYYWINSDDSKMDYLAYRYHTEGGGIRFRERIRTHTLSNAMLLQDYTNYKTDSLLIDLSQLPAMFEAGALVALSKIEIEDPRIIN